MARSTARVVAWVVAALVALAAVALVAARLWIGSERGRRAVEREADRAVAGPLGGRVHVGHVGGTLVGGVTLDDVVWRDARGQVVLRARRVVARWSAARALARRPAIALRVEAPVVDLDRLFGGAVDLDAAARLVEQKRDVVDALTIDRLAVVDATVRLGAQTLRHLSLDGAAHLDKERHLGDRGSLTLERLRARAELGDVPFALGAGGTLRWDRGAGRVDAERLRLAVGDSGAVVSGHVARDGVDLALARLRVGPRDLRRLSPRATAPRAPLTGEARARGPFDRVAVAGTLRPDRGRATVDGTLDLAARRGRLTARLDDVETDYTPAVLSGTVALRGRVAGGALVVAVDGGGDYFRREVSPNLPATTPVARRHDVAAVRPGGRFRLTARLRADVEAGAPAATARFSVTVEDPGQAARLLAGPDLRAAPRPVVVDGTFTKPAHGAPTLTLRRRHAR